MTDDYVGRGLPLVQARAAARREFGGVDQLKETYRDQRGWPLIDALAQDVRYAMRTFRQHRGFAAVAVLTLALGIGANTAIFTLLDALTLRWLPVRAPQELVQLTILRPDTERPGQSFSYPLVRSLSQHTSGVFSGLFGFSNTTFAVGPAEARERTRGSWVSGSYFDTIGLTPAAGRLLSLDDDRPGASPAAVLTDAYWERRFARAPDIVGRTLLVEGVPVTIVGVSPAPFGGVEVGDVADVTLAIGVIAQILPDQASRLDADSTWLQVFARPRASMSWPQAKSGLAAAWPRVVDEAVPVSMTGARRRVVGTTLDVVEGGTGWTNLRLDFQQSLIVLMALVALVHLIACTNVANLLLARATARQREMAIRLAIGAGRGRIVRQMLTESLLLSSAGAAGGIGLAWVIERLLIDLLSGARRTPIVLDLTPHWHVLAFAVATAVATALVFGLVPALRAATAGPAAALAAGSRGSAGLQGRLAPGLVVVEVALSLLLVVGAGLFVRTLQNLRHLDIGLRDEGVLLVDADGSRAGYRGPQLSAFYDQLLRDVERLPGIRSASLSLITPLAGGGISQPVALNGRVLTPEGVHFNGVAPKYFETLGTRIVAGRDFTPSDPASPPRVAVVNDAFVRRYLSDAPPLGQHVSIRDNRMQIVGVVRDVVYESMRDAPPPTVYAPFAARPRVTLAVDAGDRTSSVAVALQRLLQAKLPGAAVEVRTLSGQIERALIRERMMAMLAGGLGALALALASIGLYGLLAYTVARRTNEIGVRMALGTARGQVLWLVISDAGRLIAIGTVAGLSAAWASSRLVSSMLFGLTPSDPVTLIGAAAVLGASGLLASFLPALRAANVDPMVALRHE